VLPYFVKEDIKYLKDSVEPELYKQMKFYDLMAPGKKVKEAKTEGILQKIKKMLFFWKKAGTTFEEMTTLDEILKYQKFTERMNYFPYIWIGLFLNIMSQLLVLKNAVKICQHL
jgi:hypothetical protein